MTVRKIRWGSIDGAPVHLFELDSSNGLMLRVSDLGCIIQALILKERGSDLVLGYDTVEEYLSGNTYFGACIGPIADRLENGCCTLDGVEVKLPRNAGPDCMHSGPLGFHRHVWNHEFLEDGIAFYRDFRSGETGFPARINVRVLYRLQSDCVFHIEYRAVSDRETAISITNHSYYNLDNGLLSCKNNRLTVFADGYAETQRSEDPICTGRILPVLGTPFELSSGRKIGDVLENSSDFREIRTGGGIDHYFIVPGSGMRDMAWLYSPSSCIRMSCRSDAPGLLIYTGNGLFGEKGKGGTIYGPHDGICFETECFPNAVNLPDRRPGVLLKAGQVFRSATEFHFETAVPPSQADMKTH